MTRNVDRRTTTEGPWPTRAPRVYPTRSKYRLEPLETELPAPGRTGCLNRVTLQCEQPPFLAMSDSSAATSLHPVCQRARIFVLLKECLCRTICRDSRFRQIARDGGG